MASISDPAVPVSIRPLMAGMHDVWDSLFQASAAFYDVPRTPDMRAGIWSCLLDPDHDLDGRLAFDSTGGAVGLVHFRPFAPANDGRTVCYLEDLYVKPDADQGIDRLLIGAVVTHATARGWMAVRWTTFETRFRARAVYDRAARFAPWLTYEVALG